MSRRTVSRSAISPVTRLTRASSGSGSADAALSNSTSSSIGPSPLPRSSKSSARRRPRKPHPPVITMRMIRYYAVVAFHRCYHGPARLETGLKRSAGVEGGRQGTVVEIVEFAADRHALREAGDAGAGPGGAVGDVMRRGLALDGGVEREDQLHLRL